MKIFSRNRPTLTLILSATVMVLSACGAPKIIRFKSGATQSTDVAPIPEVQSLNSRELSLDVARLVGKSVDPTLLPEDERDRFFDNDAYITRVQSADVSKLDSAFTAVLQSAFATGVPANLSCTDMTQAAACYKQAAAKFMRLAYRGNVTDTDIALAVKIASEQAKVVDGLRDLAWSVLVSPKFLFRAIDSGSATVGAPYELSQLELASRLSYFLWSSYPDDELLDAAAAGTLSKNISREVDRMMQDAKFQSGFMVGFLNGYFQFDKASTISRDKATFPNFDSNLIPMMMRESQEFAKYIVSNSRPVNEFLTAKYTFANDSLRSYYAVTGYTATDKTAFEKTPLDKTDRMGMMTQGYFLLVNGSGSPETSVIQRGLTILDRVMCRLPGPPPKTPPALDNAPLADGHVPTVKEQLAIHTQSPTCAACHAVIDPPGMALEVFDSVAKERSTYASTNYPVDATETLDNKSFNGPAGLIDVIDSNNDFMKCITQRVYEYGLGRSFNATESTAAKASAESLPADINIQSLIKSIVTSPQFTTEIGKGASS